MLPAVPAGRARLACLAAAALGFLAFLYFFDVRVLDPTRIGWLSTDDLATNFLGWHFFRHEAWSWPPGLLNSYASGVGASVAITDSIPLLAFLLKPFDAFLPPDFQYLGSWIALCFVLQGYFSCRLLQALGVNGARAVLGAALLTVLPFMAARATLHIPLASHFLFTATLWTYLEAARDPARFIRWVLLLPITALINPYLFVTISPVFAASVAALLWKGPVQARRRVIVNTGVAGVLSLIALYLMGFGTVSVANTWGWYGQLQVNLVAWFNSMGVGTLLPRIPLAELGQTEPFMYLGAGGIVVLVVGAWSLWRDRARFDAIYWPLAIALALLLVAAISHRVALGPWFLIDLHPLPQALQELLNPFRSAGRLAWLPTYFVMALAIAGCARLPHAGPLLLVVAVALNLVDGRQIRASGHWMMQRMPDQAMLDCSALPASVKRVQFVPQVTLENYSTAPAWQVAVCAGRQGQPMNVGALARTDMGRFNASAREAARVFDDGPSGDTAYVYVNPATGMALHAGVPPKMGGYHVYVPGASPPAPPEAAFDPAWKWPFEMPMDLTGPGRQILLWGWTQPMPQSVRTWSDRAALLLPVPPGYSGEALLKLAARAMPHGAASLSVEVSANGTALGSFSLRRDPALVFRAIHIPSEVIAASRGVLRVEFALKDVAPLEHPRSFPDDRPRFSFEHLSIGPTAGGAITGRIRGYNADSFVLGTGWSIPETWGVWSDGKRATLRLPIPAGAQSDLRLRVLAHAISRTGRQDVSVRVGDREVANWSYGSQVASESKEVVIPASVVPAGNEIEIAFEMANPGPPVNSADTRNLGFGLEDFELSRK